MLSNFINDIKYYALHILLWFVLFYCYRIVFIAAYSGHFDGVSFYEFMNMVYYGFRIDLSTTGYLIAIPLVLKTIANYIKGETAFNLFKKIIFIINVIQAILVFLIMGGELGTYGEWEGKLSTKVFVHLVNPKEVLSTASAMDTVKFVCFILSFLSLFVFGYYKLIYSTIFHIKNKFINLVYFPLLAALIFLSIRGGWQPIPIQLGNAYFSNNTALNDITTNTVWVFGNSFDKRKRGMGGNPYTMVEKKKANEIIDSLLKNEKDEAPFILNTNKPNIVFVILESWSADMIEKLGGYSDVTPNFNELTETGYLFDNFYSAGWTSDQGMAAIFSAAVVFPNFTIINDLEAFRKLPAITTELHGVGYNSSYFFGGDLDYGNIKPYLYNKNFQVIKDEDIYDEFLDRGRLGVHDSYMFEQYIKEINQLKEPFFTNLFTLSSHSPYDFNGSRDIEWGDDENLYVNSVHYTDSCLGAFFESAKQQPWYSNTLFIVLADHSHVTPKKWRVCNKLKVKVPMLFYGEVLKNEYKGKINTKIGNHLDIPTTLLYQLNLDKSAYKYSKNLLDTTSMGYASFTFHNGMGWINENGYFGYTFNYNRIYCRPDTIDNQTKQSDLEEEGFSFFHVAFDDFY